MTLLQSIILGIVEGITEFLPISSTGHLILASRLLGLPQSDFQKSFEIAIQLGAIASVIVLYWRRFLEPAVLTKVLVAFVPTGIIGFALYRVVKTYFFDSLGGVALIVFELLHREKDDAVGDVASISYSKALLIGLFQSLSIVPGVSRAGATIVGGLIVGLSRRTIVEFSFLLAVPTMLAATGYDLLKNASSFAPEEFGVLAGGCSSRSELFLGRHGATIASWQRHLPSAIARLESCSRRSPRVTTATPASSLLDKTAAGVPSSSPGSRQAPKTRSWTLPAAPAQWLSSSSAATAAPLSASIRASRCSLPAAGVWPLPASPIASRSCMRRQRRSR